MALRYRQICVGPFGMNACVLWCEQTREGLLIDPGDEIDRLAKAVNDESISLKKIVLTHAHIDHVLRANTAQELFGLPVFMHRDDQQLLDNLPAQAAMLGLGLGAQVVPPKLAGFLAEGEVVTIGRHSMKVLHTPGHSPGSITLLADELAVVGDVLFRGSIGRTDLPGGSMEVLMASIRTKLLPLDDAVIVLSGHGEESTIGFERLHNPFLNGAIPMN